MKSSFDSASMSRAIAVALVTFASPALLGGCAAGGVKVASSTAGITPSTPSSPVTPVASAAPVIPPPLGSDLTGVALNTVTNRFYVINAANGSVLVFDAATNLPLDAISVGGFPVGIAVNPDKNMIYVVCINSQSLLVIDGAKDKVVATLSLGINPTAVAVNPVTNKVYVASGSVEYQNAPPPTPPLPLPPTPPAVSLLFPNLTVVDGATNKVMTQVAIAGGTPVALAINSKTNTVYVATTVGLGVVNGANDTLTTTLGSQSIGYDALDPTTTPPYTAYPNQAEFWGSFDVAVDESTNTVYVANEGASNSLTVVDGATNTITESIPLNVDVCVLDVNGHPVLANGVPVFNAIHSPARRLAVNPVSHMVYVSMEIEDMKQGKYVFYVFDGATTRFLGEVGLDNRGKNRAVAP